MTRKNYSATRRPSVPTTGWWQYAFILLALSGLSFFQPLYFPLTMLFGGGVWTRILHPVRRGGDGVSSPSMFLRLSEAQRHDARPTGNGSSASANWWTVTTATCRKRASTTAVRSCCSGCWWPAWCCSSCPGIVIWRAYFSFLFPIGSDPFRFCRHAVAAAIMIALIIIHIYAAIWIKGASAPCCTARSVVPGRSSTTRLGSVR